MSKDQMFAKVVLASMPTNGAPPIITIHARYPRIIHGEIMTHRVFSRNARSSRAVPVATMLKEIRETPFVPWHWGKNQKGMQASEECSACVQIGNKNREPQMFPREDAWRAAANNAVDQAQAFANAGYHKQIANRLIEPFSFIDTLITSTSWANFFHLRHHPDAEPHFQDLAKMIREAVDGAVYQMIEPGEWHTPYADDGETYEAITQYLLEQKGELLDGAEVAKLYEIQRQLSVARCARISYKPFDGDASIERELERYEQLVGSDPLHASPAEHQATPDTESHYERLRIEGDNEELLTSGMDWDNPQLSGNLGPGWVQYRKTLPGEFVADRSPA